MFGALVVGCNGEVAERVEGTLRLAWPDGSFRRSDNGLDAVGAVRETELNLVVLDLDLPTMDALDALTVIRRFSAVPFIVVEGQPDDTTWMQAIGRGADEHLIVPFSSLELLARAKAVVQRPRDSVTAWTPPRRFDDGYLSLDLATGQVCRAGAPVCLTCPERKLLARLVDGLGNVVASRCLLRELWGHDDEDRTEFLRVYVQRLREKIEADPDSPRYLISERGVGYRFGRPG